MNIKATAFTVTLKLYNTPWLSAADAPGNISQLKEWFKTSAKYQSHQVIWAKDNFYETKNAHTHIMRTTVRPSGRVFVLRSRGPCSLETLYCVLEQETLSSA